MKLIKGYPVLEGARGAKADIPALEEMLCRVSRLAADFPQIVEMDLNPVKILPPGQVCVVVDARIRLASPSSWKKFR